MSDECNNSERDEGKEGTPGDLGKRRGVIYMAASDKTISTDVLVIGGGIGGVCAAIKAAEQKASVLVVEKADPRWGGQAPFSGGAFFCLFPDDDKDKWFKETLEDCQYLNDRQWLLKYGEETYRRLHELSEWGVPFKKDAKGGLQRQKIPAYQGSQAVVPQPWKIQPVLVKNAVNKGVKILNKTYVPELIEQDGRVIGAVGFDLITGDFFTFVSKTVIIACGGCNYGIRRLFSMDYGEGILAAYQVGAELRNAEFGNQYTPVEKETESWTWASHLLENVDGERILTKHFPGGSTREIGFQTIKAMYKEIRAGKGPIFQNFTGSPELVEQIRDIGGPVEGYNLIIHCFKKKMDLTREKVEMKPSLSAHVGPIKTDLNCETTVSGLYAIGDANYGGSAFLGTLPPGSRPGYALPFAVISGLTAGELAGKKALSESKHKANKKRINELKEQILAPLKVKRGFSPYDSIYQVQEAVSPLDYNFIRSGSRLKEALNRIEAVKAKIPKLAAKDVHDVMRCCQVKSMAFCAELQHKAALIRTETRGSHIREDYPEKDDKNWLKWIEIKKEINEMKLWTVPVPQL